MSAEEDIQALTDNCLNVQLGEAKSPNAAPEQVRGLLDKRLNVGRRNIGKLLCEAEGCSATCIVSVEEGVPKEYRMSELTNLFGNCVLWKLTTEQ